jgi:MSHA biogenesis protein MshK
VYKCFVLFLIITSVSVNAKSVDPTKPFNFNISSVASVANNNALVLQTIVENDGQKSVVINGQLLSLGDQIRQYTLSEITKHGVLLSSPEKNIKLSMFSSVVAKSK